MDANGPSPAPEPDPARPQDPDSWDDEHFTRAWESIVADLTSADQASTQQASTDQSSDTHTADRTSSDPAGVDHAGLDQASPDQAAGSGAAPGAAPRTAPGGTSLPSDGLAALFEPLRRAGPPPAGAQPPSPGPETTADAAAARAQWEDEGHFVPPPPPDLPEGTPLSRLAWVGTLGGPAVLLGAALTGIDLPHVVSIAAGLAALAGFATLVWLLPDSREDSGWDDGAQL